MPLLALLLSACHGDNEFTALKPDIVLSPEVVDFGAVVQQYSVPLTAEVINAGQGKLEIDSVELSGDGASAFTVAELPDEIQPDSAYPLVVVFLPENPISYTAHLNIRSNDPDEPDVAMVLTGTGKVAPTPDISCDPLVLDFGTVAPGSVGTAWVTCTNEGDDDLSIDTLVQAGGGNFTLAGDPSGYLLPPGQALQIIVVYTPTSDSGDSGSFTLTTNDPDEPEIDVTLLGNGGADFEYPVAVIDGPSSVEPRTTITLDGSGSYDPAGHEPLAYHWTVVGPYDDIALTESGAELYAQLDLAGGYVVSLQVENSIGVLSAPAVYAVEAVPVEEMHVELIWEDLADLDLHLMNSSGELFVEPDDCNYCNPNPSWGEAGSADDPTLDLDALSAPPGVENINIESPAEDAYRIRVHYFESNGDGDVAATVNVYLYGELAGTYSRVLQRNTVWDVAQVIWPEAYVIEEETDLYAPDLRTCQ